MSVAVYGSFQPQGSKLPHLKVRPLVAIWALVVIILCFSLCVGTRRVASLYQHQSVSADSLQASAAHATNAQPPVVSDTNPASQPPVAASTRGTVVTNCTPYAGPSLPTALSLSANPDGLTTQVDSPSTYQIYGNTPATLRSQIRQCASKSDGSDGAVFTAQTTYKLTWQYNYVIVGEGTCKITHAKVGIHVMQIMPLWQPSTAAQAGLSSQWQSFMSSLTTHENGHTALDVQYAQTLLDDLNSFPATSCGQLAQSVKHLTDSDVATLNQANDNYDSSTNHGATQGAILP